MQAACHFAADSMGGLMTVRVDCELAA